MKDRSGVQNSAALLGRHLLPEQDSQPLGMEEVLTDRNVPRPTPPAALIAASGNGAPPREYF